MKDVCLKIYVPSVSRLLLIWLRAFWWRRKDKVDVIWWGKEQRPLFVDASSLSPGPVRSKLLRDWQKSFPIVISPAEFVVMKIWPLSTRDLASAFRSIHNFCFVTGRSEPILNSTTWPVRTLTHLICMVRHKFGFQGLYQHHPRDVFRSGFCFVGDNMTSKPVLKLKLWVSPRLTSIHHR